MKLKKLITLLIVLAVLIVLAAVKISANRREAAKEKQPAVLYSLNKDVSTAFVSKLAVYRGDDAKDKVVLEKSDAGDWSVTSHFGQRARKDAVERLLKDAAGLKGEVRADKKDVLGDFHLTDAQAVHIEFYGPGDKPLADTLVSPLRVAASENFARSKNSDKVIAADTDVLSDLGIYDKDAKPDYKRFADMQALNVKPDELDRIEIAQEKAAPLVLVKQPDKGNFWVFEPADPKVEVDPNKVTQYVNLVNNLYASETLDPTTPGLGLASEPLVSLTVKKEGKPSALKLFAAPENKDKKTADIRVDSTGPVFRLGAPSVDALKKDKNFFLKPGKTA